MLMTKPSHRLFEVDFSRMPHWPKKGALLFFLEMGDTDYAEDYLRRSHAHCDEWGCKAKLRQLQDKYTFLISCNDHTNKRCSTFRFGKESYYSAKSSQMHMRTHTNMSAIGTCHERRRVKRLFGRLDRLNDR